MSAEATLVKLSEHDGVQSIPLPEGFRFEGTEVVIEKQGDRVIIMPKREPMPEFKTFDEIARYLAEKFPDAPDFPDLPPRPREHERPILQW